MFIRVKIVRIFHFLMLIPLSIFKTTENSVANVHLSSCGESGIRKINTYKQSIFSLLYIHNIRPSLSE